MEVITIGRSSENNITVNDSQVSRHHCQIVQHDNGTYSLVDFGSTNGTYVNGQRISGQVALSPNDIVSIGSTTLPWQSYFPTHNYPNNVSQPHKSHTTGIVLGIVGGVLLLAAIIVGVIFLSKGKTEPSLAPGHFLVDDVELGFDMTIDDIRQANPEVSITKYTSDNNLDEEVASVYYSSFDYYLIGNSLAISLDEKTNRLYSFTTSSKNYMTEKGLHVGSTWGEMVEAYPNLTFLIDFYYYDHWSHQHRTYITAYDETTCTFFAFDENQFTKSQINALYAIANPSDFDSYFEASAISPSIYTSICSSIYISEIAVNNCHEN